MNHQLVAGILLGGASAAAANVGVVVEKIAMRRMPPFGVRKTTDMVYRLIRNPFWVLGFCLIAVGLVVQVLALSLASISVIQAVAPTGTVLLLVLSHIFLGDRLRRAEYAGIASLVVALALLVLSLDARSDRATGSTHLSALLAVTIPTACLSLLTFVAATHIGGTALHRRKLKAPLYGVATGLLYGCAALDMKSISTLMQRWGVVAAIPRILASPTLYLLLVTTALAFLMFQMALQRSITSVLVPVSSVLSTAYFMVVGDALFHEHLPQAPLSLSLRLASFALLGVGLFAVTVVNETHAAEMPGDVSGSDTPTTAPLPAEIQEGHHERASSENGEALADTGSSGKLRRAVPESARHGDELPSGEAFPRGYLRSMRLRIVALTLLAGGTVLVAILPVPWVALIVMVAALVALSARTIVARQHTFFGQTAERLRVAQRSAHETSAARDRVETTLLLAATDSAFIGVDPTGTINLFSAGSERLFGYSAAEVVGTRSLMDLIDVAQIEERRQKVGGMGLYDAEMAGSFPRTLKCKDGQLRRCLMRVRPLPVTGPDAEGGYVVVARDVTEREQLQSDSEFLSVLQNKVTQSLIEQDERLRRADHDDA
jgi:PAS domain S-box-containing protein